MIRLPCNQKIGNNTSQISIDSLLERDNLVNPTCSNLSRPIPTPDGKVQSSMVKPHACMPTACIFKHRVVCSGMVDVVTVLIKKDLGEILHLIRNSFLLFDEQKGSITPSLREVINSEKKRLIPKKCWEENGFF